MSRARPWLGRPWGQWTLRTRMVVAIAALAAIGLVVVSVSSVFLLRSYLVGRVDRQLANVLRPVVDGGFPRLYVGVGTGANGTGAEGGPFSGDGSQRSEFGPPNDVRVYLPNGQQYPGAGTSGQNRPNLGTFTELKAHADEGPFTVDADGLSWRVQVVTTRDGNYVVAGVSLTEIDDTQLTLLVLSLTTTALVLLGICVAAATVVRVGLRPLTRMERAAAEIAGGDLSRRVEDADPHTESGRLGTALNTMLVRIETAMTGRVESERRLRQFLADAAHELRTPLTSIQGFAELYRRGGAPPGPGLDEAMGAIEAEVGRMRLLVNDLLLLARLDEERPLVHQQVDLLEVAADTVRDAHVRVPTRFVLLGPLDDAEETFDAVTVAGDEARLRQVATNLVVNALQHTPDNAEVIVRVGRCVPGQGPGNGPADGSDGPTATTGRELDPDVPVGVIEVADTGPGLCPDDAQRVFERLYRADPSRSRRYGGAGLGLSIVSAIVQAHGGRVELWTAPGEGARFRVLLPETARTRAEPGEADRTELEPAATGHSKDWADSEPALR